MMAAQDKSLAHRNDDEDNEELDWIFAQDEKTK